MLLDSEAAADTPRVRGCDSVMSIDDDADKQQALDGTAAAVLSQSFASGSMTELSSLYSMSEDVSNADILITNTKTNITRCSAIAERPRCRVRYSFRQK